MEREEFLLIDSQGPNPYGLFQHLEQGVMVNEGTAMFCRIRGYISTLRKQDVHTLTALRSVFEGSPYRPALST